MEAGFGKDDPKLGLLGAVDELGRLIALYYNDGAAAIAAVTDAVGRVDEWRKGRREPQP